VPLFTIQNEFRYEITRKIFEGGMGVVYEGEQHGARNFVKRVAIKIIRPSFASQKMFIENFIGEAKLVADLIHTNIVQTYHLGEANGMCFIAMELIRGVNLEQFTRQVADKRRVLPKELAVFITSRISRGLAYAHAKTNKNGKPLGIVWKTPYRVDATGALKAGANQLEIKVTNGWANRIIGDRQSETAKQYMLTVPTFYKASAPLWASGLLGPVKLVQRRTVFSK